MNWNEIYATLFLTEPHFTDILMRLGCAMLVGLVIGTEREFTHRPAGLRTHILVALGACVVSITGEMIFQHYSQLGATADPARLSAQVIAGVGFLGAGTIMREGVSVKGLTTAASVWSVACLGIAAGFGYYTLSISGMLLILITLTVFERLQGKLINHRRIREKYELETTDISASLALVNEAILESRGSITHIDAVTLERGHRLSFRADFGGRHHTQHRQQFFNALAQAPEITSIRYTDELHAHI